MVTYIRIYNIAILILCVAVLVEYCIITAFPQNRKFFGKNKPLVLYTLGSIVLHSMLIFLFRSSRLGESAFTAICILLLVACAIFIYATVLLTASFVLHKKGGKPLLGYGFASTSDMLRKIDDGIKERRRSDIPFAKRMLIIAAPAVLLTYMLEVFGIYETFFGNLSDWIFVFDDFYGWSLIVFGISSLVLIAGGALVFRGESCKTFSVFLGVLCIAAYLQNNILNFDIILDGTDPNAVNIYGIPALLGFFLWAVLFVAAFVLYRRIKDLVKYISGVALLLLIMQIAPLFAMLADAPETSIKKTETTVYTLDGSEQFAVSSEENVTVFIMDTFSSIDMISALENNAEYYSLFKDFYFFDNISTESFNTCFSVPCLLTATRQDYSISLVEANRNCWQSEKADNFYDTMHNDGFEVRLYTDSDIYAGGAENMQGRIDNIKHQQMNYETDGAMTYLSLLRLSFFKYLPNVFKMNFMIYGANDINNYTHFDDGYGIDYSDWHEISNYAKEQGISFYNHDVMDGFRNNASVTSEGKLCTFMHTFGTHEPLYGDSLSELVSLEDEVRRCLDIVTVYTDKLKEAGSYDESTIIVTADHGYHGLTRSSPIMLIKPKGHTGDRLAVNSAPGVLQSDLLPTMLDCIGEDSEKLGSSLLKLDENAARERVTRDFIHRDDMPEVRKIIAFGKSVCNCYDEYHFTGRVADITESDKVGTFPITDFWW